MQLFDVIITDKNQDLILNQMNAYLVLNNKSIKCLSVSFQNQKELI